MRIVLLLMIATLMASTSARTPAQQEPYTLGPDSQLQPGVPRGTVTEHAWTSPSIFPGTERQYWVYVPAQYDPATPACVMVFQDGGNYVTPDGAWRVPVAFDNLIHREEMPVTIGVFVNPGVVPAAHEGALPRFNRSVEYDSVSPRYARFLLEEILPEVGRRYNLTTDGNCRAIGGASSGAIAAFVAAWHRPDAFRRVFSTIGTYVGLRGGHELVTLIRKTERKPLRVYLQDGSDDLNNYVGNWFIANQDMLSALEFGGYDVNHEWGVGAHNSRHGGALLPEALRWLWRDYPAQVMFSAPSKQPVMNAVVHEDSDWQLVSEGHRFTEGPASDAAGEVFFTDVPANRIHRVGLDGVVRVFREDTHGAAGLMFGPDGRLYAAEGRGQRVMAYGMDGTATVIAEGIAANDLAVSHKGDVYVTDSAGKQVWLVPAGSEKRVVDTGIERPNGVLLSPDQSLLLVSDWAGQFVYSFQIAPDGSLRHKQAFYHLHLVEGSSRTSADGMTVDANGTLYVATELGVQVADQAGKVNGILPKPHQAFLANVAFGGPDRDELYMTIGDKVLKRRLRQKGVLSFEPPVMPARPRL